MLYNNQQRYPGSQLSPPIEGHMPKATAAEDSRQELREAIQGSNDVLTTATTVSPVFSDTLAVDRAKLTVTKRSFFRTAEMVSIRIEDVLNVTATVAFFWGSVKIVSRVFSPEKPYIAGPFTRKDALRLKRVIQGYVIALQRKIDCSALSTAELVAMLDKLGADQHAAM